MAETESEPSSAAYRLACRATSGVEQALLLVACYFVATLASQAFLLYREGAWYGSACSLYGRIALTEVCTLSAGQAGILAGAKTYLLADLDVLVLLAATLAVLAGGRVLIGVVRRRLAERVPALPASFSLA